MMTLRELTRAVEIIDRELAGARVERIAVAAARRVVVSLRARERGEVHLLLCSDPACARLSLLEARPASGSAPAPFAELLRARIAGTRLAGARILDADRVAALRFEGPEAAHELLLALLGPRTNVLLLDGELRIAGSLRPLVETRRDLAAGAPWRSPASRPPPAGEDRFAGVPDARFFAELEALAGERERAMREAEQVQRVERALRRGVQSLEKKLAALREDAASGALAGELRKRGELLKSVLAQVRPGAREVRARDFESGEELAIELDPALSPRANLEELFRRARKAEKRAERGVRELGAAEERRAALRALEGDFAALAGSPERVAAFAARPEVERLLARFSPERAASPPPGENSRDGKARAWRIGTREVPSRLQPRVYRSSTGLEIWVGRSDEGNDLLSTRLARGHDLFFHLEASPGSHVVLRTEGRSDPPAEAVLEACELAVHFSRHRKVMQADVLVAPIKNVRKPRGAKRGLVWVTGGKTVRLRRDPKRLERVLASRSPSELAD
jgi:predicted ribosome quality control (RQC) complex YloA/Tae2 family protein